MLRGAFLTLHKQTSCSFCAEEMSGEPPVSEWSRDAGTPQCAPCAGETVPEMLIVSISQQQAPKSAGFVPAGFMTLDDSLNFSESQLSYLEGGKHWFPRAVVRIKLVYLAPSRSLIQIHLFVLLTVVIIKLCDSSCHGLVCVYVRNFFINVSQSI